MNDLGNYRGKRKPSVPFNGGKPLTPKERREELHVEPEDPKLAMGFPPLWALVLNATAKVGRKLSRA